MILIINIKNKFINSIFFFKVLTILIKFFSKLLIRLNRCSDFIFNYIKKKK